MEELIKAKKRALYLLTSMDRTEKELLGKLTQAGYSEDTIARTMEYVRSFGYIDDRRYAERYIETAKNRKSRRKIAGDLMMKGVDREIIDEALLAMDDRDERVLIRALAEKKLKTLDPSDPKTYTKTAAHLARKGFAAADIIAVLNEFVETDDAGLTEF